MIIDLNPVEYRDKKRLLSEKEGKVDFLSGLIDMWKAHHFILGTLSSNIRTEAGMAQ
jgi:hypothetical protein